MTARSVSSRHAVLSSSCSWDLLLSTFAKGLLKHAVTPKATTVKSCDSEYVIHVFLLHASFLLSLYLTCCRCPTSSRSPLASG